MRSPMDIASSPGVFILFLIFGLLFSLYYFFINKKVKSFKGLIIRLAAIYYLCALYAAIGLTIRPGLSNSISKAYTSLFDYPLHVYLNYIPFKNITDFIQRELWIQLVGNLALLMPIPIFTYLIFNKKSFKLTVLSSLIISLTIEASQFICNVISKAPNCATDIDDVILNVCGAILSFALLNLITFLWYNLIRKRR